MNLLELRNKKKITKATLNSFIKSAKVLYVDDDEEVIFYHYKEIDTIHSHMVRTTRCYFNYDLIWSFLQNEMNMGDYKIGEMMAFWIKDFYDIDLRPVKLKITYDMLD